MKNIENAYRKIIRIRIADLFEKSFKSNYEDLSKVSNNITLCATKLDKGVVFFTVSGDFHSQKVLTVSSTFLNNYEIIEACKAKMTEEELSKFYDYLDFMLDHDSYRHALDINMLESIKSELPDIYWSSVNAAITEHLQSRNMQILIETYTTEVYNILKKRGDIND